MIIKDIMYDQNEFGMNYRLYLPKDRSTEELPLLIYLHGAGERGKAIDHLARHGVPLLIKNGREIAAVVLCPQCPEWCVWCNVVDRVKGIIDSVVAEYGIKRDRICITGSSMGGFGSWSMGVAYGDFFSAVVPVAGGGMSWRASNLLTTAVRAYHGSADDSVEPVYSKLMIDRLKSLGGNAELFLLEGWGHNDGINYAYRETELIEWMLKQRKTDFNKPVEPCSQYY